MSKPIVLVWNSSNTNLEVEMMLATSILAKYLINVIGVHTQI